MSSQKIEVIGGCSSNLAATFLNLVHECFFQFCHTGDME